jgi:uncharacterized protein with NAD-binding domain and iron-sulfur cluster
MTRTTDNPTAKQKIAILGGGVGAMASAWQLTSEPGWQDRYDITVYQMGWRLGGKGASGRRPPHWRIEEHGLHIWLGFYHNAFSALQAAHIELNPDVAPAPAGNSPPRMLNGVFARCEDAFDPHSFVGVFQTFNGEPNPWMLDMPTNDQKPWEGQSLPTLASYVQELVQLLVRHGKGATRRDNDANPADDDDGILGWIKNTVEDLVDDIEDLTDDVAWATVLLLQQLVDEWADDTQGSNNAVTRAMHKAIGRLQRWLVNRIQDEADDDIESLRRLLLMDLFVAVLRGLLEGEVRNGEDLSRLDDDFRLWLKANGALPLTCSLETNPLLRGVYDFVFAFDDGDSSQLDARANFATAPALRTIFRMCFTYEGAIFWKMRAGMGDTIFTPLYKALEQRGVAFKFFHKVQALRLSDDGRSVAAIDMVRQVDTVQPYQPLVRVNGLDCWPSLAQYDQIVQGAALQAAEAAQSLNLESLWFEWDNAQALRLERGVDFDQVVFGISLGSVPLLCAELCAAFPAWQRMVDTVKTVCTMGVQHWLKPDLAGLGWTQPSPVMDAYHEPLDTWADMSHLLPREVWPPGHGPANVAYFCGALPEGPLDPADRNTPHRALAAAQAASNELLDRRLADLWPAVPNGNGGIQRDLVMDSYVRANVDPSERYVMSVAHSNSARLKANETGCDNLVITGDWIDNGFNAGCVEASFMAGMQAGNAIRGLPLNQGVKGRELSE